MKLFVSSIIKFVTEYLAPETQDSMIQETISEHKKKILISDDDPDDQFILKTAIKEIAPDADILFFLTSQQLIQYLLESGIQEENHKLPDMIIGDMKPPFFDLKDISEIRTFKQFRKIPVYVFAECYSEVNRETALHVGAKGFFHKPNSLHQLKDIFSSILAPHSPESSPEKSNTEQADKKDSAADLITVK